MPIELPSVRAASAHRAVTLGELRELVHEADRLSLSDQHIVRGSTIPFKVSDLGNARGGCLTALALDDPEPAGR